MWRQTYDRQHRHAFTDMHMNAAKTLANNETQTY